MKVTAPFPTSNEYVAWGVKWINGVADVDENLGEKLIRKGYTKVTELKEAEKKIKKKDKE